MSAGRVLVTGASGFVGSRTLAPLRDLGFAVHAVSRRRPDGPIAAHHAVDLLDPAAVRALVAAVKPSHVLHLAWFAEHGRFWNAPENLDWMSASFTLARLAAQHGTRRFVGVGSCAEYDWSDGGAAPRREDDLIAPTTLYGRAKAVTGGAIAALCADAGMSFAWARLFHLFGAGEPPTKLVSSVITALRAGRSVELKAGAAVRDHLAVEDAGACLAALVAADISGPVNIASGTPTTVQAVAALLAEIAGRPDLLPPVSHQLPPEEVASMRADVTRLDVEVGVAPRPALRAALQRVWDET